MQVSKKYKSIFTLPIKEFTHNKWAQTLNVIVGSYIDTFIANITGYTFMGYFNKPMTKTVLSHVEFVLLVEGLESCLIQHMYVPISSRISIRCHKWNRARTYTDSFCFMSQGVHNDISPCLVRYITFPIILKNSFCHIRLCCVCTALALRRNTS